MKLNLRKAGVNPAAIRRYEDKARVLKQMSREQLIAAMNELDRVAKDNGSTRAMEEYRAKLEAELVKRAE